MTIDQCLHTARLHLLNTKTSSTQKISRNKHRNNHQSRVCIVCDKFLYGIQKHLWITKKQLIQNKHCFDGNFINVQSDELKKCYTVNEEGLNDLYLSPPAPQKKQKFMCCNSCYCVLSRRSRKNMQIPGKYFISNCLAMGHVPKEFWDIPDEMINIIAPIRPFAYMVSYDGGTNKKLRATYSFYEQNVIHNIAAARHVAEFWDTGRLNVILHGKFTQGQYHEIQKHTTIDYTILEKLFHWYKMNNPNFFNKELPTRSSVQPKRIQVPLNNHNEVDPSTHPTIENTLDVQYYYPTVQMPTDNSGTEITSTEFAASLLEHREPVLLQTKPNTEPILIFRPGQLQQDHKLQLEHCMILQFPFGVGGPNDPNRPIYMTFEEWMRYIIQTSLPQFQRQTFLLVLYCMYNRIRSFQTGIIRCKTKMRGFLLAEAIAKLNVQQIRNAALRRSTGVIPNKENVSDQLIKTIETSYKPIAHSSAAARLNRLKHFALWDHFGFGSIFLTFSPCDECSFRVQLFWSAGSSIPEPNPGSLDEQECLLDLRIRFRI